MIEWQNFQNGANAVLYAAQMRSQGKKDVQVLPLKKGTRWTHRVSWQKKNEIRLARGAYDGEEEGL
jgi:hypothetical protein